MSENDLKTQKEKKLKVCKISTYILIGLAIALICTMVAWLLVKAKSNTAMLILSVIAGVLILSIIVTYFVNYKFKKDADQIQNEIDNE